MKKFFMFLMATVLLLGATSCTSCNKENAKADSVVESVINSDLQYMADNYGDFVMYESSIVLKDWLDTATCTGEVENVTNIFQIGFEGGISDTAKVVTIYHCGDIVMLKEIPGYWCEDVVLKSEDVQITYKQAYDFVMATDCIKPHSKHCVLRKPLGPKVCNAQYIFGDAMGLLLFVDAITGEVSYDDPAFKAEEESPVEDSVEAEIAE